MSAPLNKLVKVNYGTYFDLTVYTDGNDVAPKVREVQLDFIVRDSTNDNRVTFLRIHRDEARALQDLLNELMPVEHR